MGINLNWDRWIFASICNYFTVMLPSGNKLYIEGQNKKEEGDYFDLRTSAIDWTKQPGNMWHGELIVNFLVKCVKDENDFHKIYRMVGIIQSIMPSCIVIKKYGDTLSDDSNIIISELTLFSKAGRTINTEHFGQLVNDVPSLQSTVEANYRTDLETDD